jgi:hypothetical protein
MQQLAASLQRTELLRPLEPTLQRFEQGVFRLVVMGEIKKGKSSFINALLGEPDLLPIATDIATSTVYQIRYGSEKKAEVSFLPDVDSGKIPPPLLIQPDQLAAYGTESGNPGNRKRVDYIGIDLPHSLLADGLVLVDTPGVGGLYKAHRDITWKYAPSADAIFFVLDSVEAVISDDEVRFLQELTANVTRRVYFLQTKTDAGGAEQWQAWRERNLTILTDKLGWPRDELDYFPVSSRLKAVADKRQSPRHLAESGFPAVLHFLQRNLMRTKRLHLAADLSRRLLGVARELRQEALQQQQIAQAGSGNELERLGQEYGRAQRQFEEWQRTTFLQETRDFGHRLEDLKQQARSRLQDELTPEGPIVYSILSELLTEEFDPQAINEKASQIQQECLARASMLVGQVHAEFNREAALITDAAVQRLAPGFTTDQRTQFPPISAPGQLPPLPLRSSLGMEFSTAADWNVYIEGGAQYGALALTGFALVSLLLPPAVLVAPFAAVIAGWFGGSAAKQTLLAARREEAFARLTEVLKDLMYRAGRQAVAQFGELAARYQRSAEDLLQTAADNHASVLRERLQQIEDARTRSQADNQARLHRLEEVIRSLSRIESALTPILEVPRTGGPTS